MVDHYDTVYAGTGGLFEVGGVPVPTGSSLQFTNKNSLLNYRPASGPDGPLTSDLLNPLTSPAGGFADEVAALALNIDFSDAGITLGARGIPFGDLALVSTGTSYDGLTVREFLDHANFQLGGTSMFHNIFQVNGLVQQLNASCADGGVSSWARNHLRVAALAGDYNEDGIVNAADYTARRDRLGGPAGSLPNDVDGGPISMAQYATWKANFGATSGAGAAAHFAPGDSPGANDAVPEPTTIATLALGLSGLFLSSPGRRAKTPRRGAGV